MDFPVDHLSASSLSTFMRCPRQWQDKYVFGNEGPSNSALILGSAVHLGLSRALKGEDPGSYWLETLAANEGREIIWKDRADTVANLAVSMVYHYYETIGKHLKVEDTEVEIELEIPGVSIPVVGFVDIVTTDPRIIDVKTTGYFSAKQVRLNPEWKFQANVYQLHKDAPAEFHVITRAKEDPIRTPGSINDPLFVYPPDRERTLWQILQTYKMIEHCWDNYGDHTPWPGGVTHEWAGKYCGVANCCQR